MDRSHRYTLRECVKMPTARLAQEAQDDYQVLVHIAIAEAQPRNRLGYYVSESTAAWLRSPEIAEDWRGALLAATGHLLIDQELLAYTGDGRLPRATQRLAAVRAREQEALRITRAQQHQRQQADPEWVRRQDPAHIAKMRLLAARPTEARRVQARLLSRAGLPLWPPAHEPAVQAPQPQGSGFGTPSTAVGRLLRADETEVQRRALADCKQRGGPDLTLRHPAALQRWDAALRAIDSAVAPGARASQGPLTPLPVEIYAAAPPARAQALLKSRRLLAAVRQRRIECTARQRRAAPVVAADTARPWREARWEAASVLARRYRQQYEAILREVRRAGEGFAGTGTQQS